MPYLKQLLVFILLSFLFSSCSNKSKKETNVIVENINTDSLNDNRCIDPEAIEFLGIEVDSLCVKEKELGKRENLQKLFRYLKLDKYQYVQFIEDTKEYTDFTNLKPKQKYFTITKETDSSSMLQYLVFKLSDFEYVIANCTDTSWTQFNKEPEEIQPKKKKKKAKKIKPIFFHPIQVSFYEKQIDTTEIKFAAVIEKSVAKTFKENNLDQKIIEKLNKAYNGKFNINSLRKGDTLQFIYDQLSINGRFLEYGHVQAICCKTKKKQLYAVDYFVEDDSSYQYADEKGKYLKTAFIKSPLQKGGNIVSRYNLHRFHPVLQVEKAHLGTDFAAPTGSPIIATASGVVIAAQFTQNNGNYVKIRHDKVYETQYLHMSRFARGIRNGVRVQQGQVIGYVGSTGLATGPHVCYRFWKKGVQVDPLKEKLNIIKQIPESDLPNYLSYFSSIKVELEKIPIL
ncbi:MAG TPA: M23 family metallopeptidase [Chitinophagales bacterium]|jgi:murein DD-endopeptidase MepM/ murein hydrolase activator NlpD|nr:M23 family metallopeptidase [Chitinophagales bacterium]